MRIVLIGAGNLATRLGIALHEKGCTIAQVYSRTEQSAQALAEKVGATFTCKISDIVNDADLYVFSVKDDALPELLRQMHKNEALWVHTAGSVPMEIFSLHTENFGVFYPLQTFSKQKEVDFSAIPIYIEANQPQHLEHLKKLAARLSSQVIEASSEQRKALHVAAVFACNFTNHMYAIAATLLEEKGLHFDQLIPLINETAVKINTLHPRDAQTGPAVRFDKQVIGRHLEMLEDERLKTIYSLLSESIHETAKKRNKDL
ncbi:MAG: DUF2520 domain-containing protein [Bacteroidota bacterium]|nr:DUF2520 domain-containing protein [Bacteroidota bacterium]